MNTIIINKTYERPPLREEEILRYAGCRSADNELLTLLQSCINELSDKLTYTVCYTQLPVTIDEDQCHFGVFSVRSKHLAANLKDCQWVILFAATIGVQIDRLITKYGRLSATKALLLQAIGTERIESLCDVFCNDIANEMNVDVRPRFSPGYGDLPLTLQRDIFAILDCPKRIGLSLNNSLLMSPSKSVTAFIGISQREENQKGK